MVELINPVWIFLMVLAAIKVLKGVRRCRRNTRHLKHVVWDVKEKKWKAAALKNPVKFMRKLFFRKPMRSEEKKKSERGQIK